jgi:hypothetical protein
LSIAVWHSQSRIDVADQKHPRVDLRREPGAPAIDRFRRLIVIAQKREVPVVSTRLVIDADVLGSVGVLGRKVDLLRMEEAFFLGTPAVPP